MTSVLVYFWCCEKKLSEKSNLEEEGLLAHSCMVGGSQWQELEVPASIPSGQRRVVTARLYSNHTFCPYTVQHLPLREWCRPQLRFSYLN